jgi:hypothetical protein
VSSRAHLGLIRIYSTGFVKIQDADDDGTANLGDIYTFDMGDWGGTIEIYHEGDFRADELMVGTGAGYAANGYAGDITLNGNYDGNTVSTPLGDCEINVVDASYKRTSYGNPNLDVDISGYDTVTINTISGYHYGNQSDCHATDVTISAARSIDIGTVDLSAPNHGSSIPGSLELTTAAGGNTITLGTLDMDLLEYALLMPASTMNYVTGVVTNFDRTATGGTGTYSDPYVTSQTALRLTAGTYLVYDADVAGNGYLQGEVFQVADTNGVAGAGGILIAEQAFPAVGTVVTMH